MKRIQSDTGPFAIIPEWLLESGVSDRAIRLYGLLARCADADGGSYPSRAYLGKKANCSPSSVDRALGELVKAKALHIQARRDGDPKYKGQLTNYYTVFRRLPDDTPMQDSGPPLFTGDEENESHVNESTASLDHSENDLSQPPPAAASEVAVFKEVVTEYLAANKGNRVSALVRIGDSLGYERNGGFAAALVRDFHEKLSSMRMVDAMVAGITAKGDPWAYVRKALDGEARRGAGWGQQAGAQPAEGTGGGLNIVSREEVEAALKARADEAAGAGAGADTGQGSSVPLP
ncbi:hypothetical protein LCGC14_0745280 [marine sediment metagenome]|uniref:Helix-turn-helix domain-containing protein n=1 Tax=marine sediment metagenome TaxID=412755 RepID=A0A0F9Q5H7_9ZZZZ